MRKIDIEVYDDFVSPTYLKVLQDATNPEGTPWYFQGSQSLTRYDASKIEDFGFSIGLLPPWKPNEFESSRLADLIRPLIYQISDVAESTRILRCRLDMTILHQPLYRHPPHIDIAEPHVGCIVYVNDTDGDTVIYDHKQEWAQSYPENLPVKQTIAPKAGRMVLFDGSYVHTGHSPSEHQTRILINTVLA